MAPCSNHPHRRLEPVDTGGPSSAKDGEAFPWRLNTVPAVPTWTKANIPRDVWYDGARVAALLDIRQMTLGSVVFVGERRRNGCKIQHFLLFPVRFDV